MKSLVFPVALLFLAAAAATGEPKDPGKATIGKLDTSVLLGIDGDPAVAGKRALAVDEEMVRRLRSEKQLKFAHYRLLGSDRRGVFRSYENWAQPLEPSDEVLVRFEAQGDRSVEGLRLDLELWLSRKKILKTDALVTGDRPIFILGPAWRGGRLIVVLGLAPEAK
jgi:hypothetical protein